MRANELRIGNWAETPSGLFEPIIGIYTTKGHIEVSTENWVGLVDDFKPIPLTKEWHNKFGVHLDGFDSFRYVLPRKNNQQITVVFSGDYVWLRQGTGSDVTDHVVAIWNKDLTRRDMYVHEWQNFYHALTGEELTKSK